MHEKLVTLYKSCLASWLANPCDCLHKPTFDPSKACVCRQVEVVRNMHPSKSDAPKACDSVQIVFGLVANPCGWHHNRNCDPSKAWDFRQFQVACSQHPCDCHQTSKSDAPNSYHCVQIASDLVTNPCDCHHNRTFDPSTTCGGRQIEIVCVTRILATVTKKEVGCTKTLRVCKLCLPS